MKVAGSSKKAARPMGQGGGESFRQKDRSTGGLAAVGNVGRMQCAGGRRETASVFNGSASVVRWAMQVRRRPTRCLADGAGGVLGRCADPETNALLRMRILAQMTFAGRRARFSVPKKNGARCAGGAA